MTLWLLPLVPLAGALAVPAFARVTRRPSALTASAVATLVVTLLIGVWAAARMPAAAWPFWGPHLTPRLAVEGLGRVMVVLIPAIAAPIVLYAGSYAQDDRGLARLLALLTAFVGLMELLVLARDFLTLLVAWELVGACSWALIGFEWREASRPRAARDAFLTTRLGDLGLYVAAAATFSATGSLHFDALARVHGPMLGVVAAGVLLAAAAKSAQLPFSPWLFSAMAGPTPASALLHSATMVAAGVYLIALLEPVLAPVPWFTPTVLLLGIATALAGGVVASLQTDLKKALAASTSAQYGLMWVAVGAGFSAAAGTHLVTHAAFKALLFVAAGVVVHAAATLDLVTLARLGLGRLRPLLAALFAVGALALAAVPPLGGAFSKEQILAAATHAPRWRVAVTAGVLLAAVLSAFYAARLQLLAFSPLRARPAELPSDGSAAGRAGAVLTTAERISLAFLAASSLALGLLWMPGGGRVASAVIGGPLPAGAAWELGASLASVVLGGGTAWVLWRRGALASLGLPARVRDGVGAWLGLPTVSRRFLVDPVMALARALAVADDRVVDAGVRGAVRIAAYASVALGWWGERGVQRISTGISRGVTALARDTGAADDRILDRLVSTIARATDTVARGSQVTDDQGIDGAVEELARGVGVAGVHSRRLQTGLAHDYYLLAAVGAVIILLSAASAVIGRSLGL